MKIAASLIAGKKARIEMLPLIDIVFLLLVFFIYAMLSMAVHHSLPVALPTSASAEIDLGESLSIAVDAEGDVSLNGKPVSRDALRHALEQEKKRDRARTISLFADRSLKYQELFRVLDLIKQAGLENISLQADAVQQ
jgi:biopolymer transport protein ExbD